MASRRWIWLGAWVVLGLLTVEALRHVAWDDAIGLLGSASVGWLMVAVCANAAILPTSALAWMAFLPAGRSVPFRTLLWIQAVSSTAANGGPFLAGHAAGIHLLATRGGVGHAAAVSVKALDQLAEGIAKLALVAWVVLLVPLPAGLRTASLVLLAGVTVLGGVLLVALGRSHVLEGWGASGSGWRARAWVFLAQAARELESLRSPGRFALGTLMTLLGKAAELAGIAAVAAALGVQVPAWALLLSLTAVNISGMAAVTPANLGIYEGSAFVAFHLAGVVEPAALGLAVVQHLAYLAPLAGIGWVLIGFRALLPSGD